MSKTRFEGGTGMSDMTDDELIKADDRGRRAYLDGGRRNPSEERVAGLRAVADEAAEQEAEGTAAGIACFEAVRRVSAERDDFERRLGALADAVNEARTTLGGKPGEDVFDERVGLVALANAHAVMRDESNEVVACLKGEIDRLAAELAEAKRARDEWARQCNMASEHQADAVNAAGLAAAEVERLRGALEVLAHAARDVVEEAVEVSEGRREVPREQFLALAREAADASDALGGRGEP